MVVRRIPRGLVVGWDWEVRSSFVEQRLIYYSVGACDLPRLYTVSSINIYLRCDFFFFYSLPAR